MLILITFIFTAMLLALSIIDWRTKYLPDPLTFSLLWLGLLVNLNGFFVPLEKAVIGAVSGYLSLFLIATVFFYVTGKIGIGGGDLKLFAAIGAWFGWEALPGVMVGASLSGLLVMLWMIKMRGHHPDKPIPFGPFLAFFGWLTLFFIVF